MILIRTYVIMLDFYILEPNALCYKLHSEDFQQQQGQVKADSPARFPKCVWRVPVPHYEGLDSPALDTTKTSEYNTHIDDNIITQCEFRTGAGNGAFPSILTPHRAQRQHRP